jgi:ABC-type polysaccharide/polyol phosphate export permease
VGEAHYSWLTINNPSLSDETKFGLLPPLLLLALCLMASFGFLSSLIGFLIEAIDQLDSTKLQS